MTTKKNRPLDKTDCSAPFANKNGTVSYAINSTDKFGLLPTAFGAAIFVMSVIQIATYMSNVTNPEKKNQPDQQTCHQKALSQIFEHRAAHTNNPHYIATGHAMTSSIYTKKKLECESALAKREP